MTTKEEVMNKLKEVIDPELGVNIVDMGLIYKVESKGMKEGKEQFYVEMTFTTPACPLMNVMMADVQKKLEEFEDADFEVKIVFEPKWTLEKMSPEAKKKLGIK